MALLFILLGACTVSPTSFIDGYYTSTCRLLVECDEGYPDVLTCIAENEEGHADDRETFDGLAEDCEWDGGKAHDCLALLRRATCEDRETDAFEDDYHQLCDAEELWTCPDGRL